ncbi:MAG: bifunctional UDP-N-acetylmuramoyl-tripeptide:D-alanyl-D-alanine ligase/alanine racemase [Paramuribaculum sp.]|nr:bifunctional UDP-N-acetylmuramoyl-tripeptide:D-alanyl-D-alanine ligase/alanine racemase [Paramuribaculum sp.]
MKYSTSEICRILNLPQTGTNRELSVLLTDSRSLTNPENSLFFAITTSNNDGHRYIAPLYETGVRTFVVTHIPEEMEHADDADFLLVPDVTKALQAIARHHRRRFSIPIIGITGSHGKTTVKEWLYQSLCDTYGIVRSPRSYNSQIGVPLSIWEIDDETGLAIIEAGVSRQGEMGSLRDMINPEIGIITNLDDEHDRGFSSRQKKCEEKVSLFTDCRCLIYCADDPMITEAIEKTCRPEIEIGWSTKNPDAVLAITEISKNENSSDLSFRYLGISSQVSIPFTDDARIHNAIHVLATMLFLNRPVDEIKKSIAGLTPVMTRINVIEGVNDCMLIYDSYTSDLHSLNPALDFMHRRRSSERSSTLILSDVMHETLPPARIYQTIAELVKIRKIDRLIGIGPEFMRNSRYFDPSATFYPDTTSFLTSVSPGDFDKELILIKGAPAFNFERIVDMLESRQHETVLEVNLDAIVDNYNYYRSMVRPTTGIVCMVKASGYGAGSYELAKTLQSQGAAYLAVAVLDEGVDLRRAGISMPIMVLNPKVVNYRTLFAYNLEPEIYSFEVLDELIREGEKYGISDYPVHIKLDTGMHRLGFLEQDIPLLIDILRRQKVVRPSSVFSHLAVADEPDQDDYTMKQFEIFDRCSTMLQSGFHHHIMRHILNSTGITRFPDHQYDLVRLGICLYGIHTLDDGSQNALRPVSSLSTTIISIKEWDKGTTIGYGRRGLVTKPSRIATIPVGYADGINRHLGNGNMKVHINGILCPTIGNICMDACMIDVTDTDCKVGDRVEIFGENVPVAEIARTLDTIPYEILTSVSSRVKRIYFRE